jgi:predicted nucleic acid-binding protein
MKIATTPTDSKLYLVDSSGWVEYLGGGPKADAFASFLRREDKLLVPSVVIYEVHKKLARTANRTALDAFISHALRCFCVSLDSDLAIAAAQVSVAHSLAMADAIVYATARQFGAELITADLDFKGLAGVVIP